MYEILAAAVFGTAGGALSGFIGMGGGAILAPLFVLTLGMEQHRAQGVSLAALLPPVSLPAVLAYRRAGIRLDVPLIAQLVVGFIVGAPAGAWLAHRVPARELALVFAVFLLYSAVRGLLGLRASAEEPKGRAGLGLPIGFASGIAAGLLGVGGGIVAMPLLRRFAGLGRLDAQATTLAMMLPPIGLPAVLVYAREQGGLPWALLAALAVGYACGSWGGALLAGKANPRAAALFYAGFLALMALLLVIRS